MPGCYKPEFLFWFPFACLSSELSPRGYGKERLCSSSPFRHTTGRICTTGFVLLRLEDRTFHISPDGFKSSNINLQINLQHILLLSYTTIIRKNKITKVKCNKLDHKLIEFSAVKTSASFK